MRNLVWAERVLSLFVDKCMASSIVGDLAERSGATFWFSVLGTAFAFFVEPVRANPFRIAVLVLGGWTAMQIGMSGIIPLTFHLPFLVAQEIFAWLIAAPLIGFLCAKLTRGRAMTSYFMLALAALATATFCSVFGHGSALALSFAQKNIVAAFLLVSVGAIRRASTLSRLHRMEYV